MNKFLRTLVTYTLTLLGVAPSRAQAETPLKIKDFVNNLESQKGQLQGGAVAILYKGEVIYKITFGNQKGNAKPITEQTLFAIASLSKPVSATAIALMVDQGKLNLDLNETFKLPYFKYPINLLNILTHTTGYKFLGNAQIEQGMSRLKLLNTLKEQQPHCQPGEYYWYSNAIFSIIEEALHVKNSSLALIINNLCTSLQTQEIKLWETSTSEALAYPHFKEKVHGKDIIKPFPRPSYYPKIVPASAGIFVSINGMIEVFKLSFGYRPDLISQAALDRMFTPVIPAPDVFKWPLDWPVDKKNIEPYYALGWRVLKVKDVPNKDLIFHPGYINGFTSFMGFMPSEEIGIIILANQTSDFPFKNGIKFWGEFLK